MNLVLLPGLDGTGLLFQPLLQKIQSEIKILVVKYPSDKQLSYPQLIKCVLAQLPPNKSLIILAESFSGPIAIDLLRSSPQNIRGVIFCATFAKTPRPFLLHFATILPLSKILRLPIPLPIIRFFCFGKEASDSLLSQFQESLNQVQPTILAQRLKMLTHINVVSALTNIQIPCCYIQAIDDKLVPAQNLLPFQTMLPNLWIIKKIKGPHFMLQVKPEACVEVIKDFLQMIRQDDRYSDK